jgi:hypothetical protein
MMVNLERLLELADGGRIRVVEEDELQRLFPGCEPGAVPPLGPLFGQVTVSRQRSGQRACRLEFRDQGVLKDLALGWWRGLEGKRQRTEAIHGRARFVQVPKQTLADIVTFPHVDPSLRGAEAIDA